MLLFHQLLLTFFSLAVFTVTVKAQAIVKDTVYSNYKIDILSKKDGKKFGYSYHYSKYSDTPKIDKISFYIDNRLNGLVLEFRNNGEKYSTSIYRNDVCLFQKFYSSDGMTGEHYYSKIGTYVQWEKSDVARISYSDLKEDIIFYSDNRLKSITITDSSQNNISRNYYEFSKEGLLLIEGVYADSFVEILDTIEDIGDGFEANVYVVAHKEPLKNGVWSYYSPEGVLLRKKEYKYYTEKKGEFKIVNYKKEED